MGLLTWLRSLAAITVLVMAVGCTSRTELAAGIASEGRFIPRRISAERFDLFSYIRHGANGAPLTVYIEGDGLAWITPYRPSPDPTPKDPIALRLAAVDPGTNVAWLARPCQYVGGVRGRGCAEIYWTEGRFAEEVVTATSAAVDQLKIMTDATSVRLVGYSGGGAVAALVAARRSDVDLLVTVAGMLNSASWTRDEKLTPLWYSLDPADAAKALVNVRQIHFVGANDTDVPITVARAFALRFPAGHSPVVDVVAGYDHRSGWIAGWPKLRIRATEGARLP